MTNEKNTLLEEIKQELTDNAKALQTMINYDKSHAKLPKNKHAFLYKAINELYSVFVDRHKAIEQGNLTKELENACYDSLRKVFALIGKVNGFNLTCFSMTDKQAKRNLFDDCIRYIRKDKNIVIDKELATLRSDKILASQEIKQAKANKDINALLLAENKVKELAKKIEQVKKDSNKTRTIDIFEKPSIFAKNFAYSLSLAINNQLTRNQEEIEQERKAKNKERKASRKANKQAKTTEQVATTENVA